MRGVERVKWRRERVGRTKREQSQSNASRRERDASSQNIRIRRQSGHGSQLLDITYRILSSPYLHPLQLWLTPISLLHCRSFPLLSDIYKLGATLDPLRRFAWNLTWAIDEQNHQLWGDRRVAGRG